MPNPPAVDTRVEKGVLWIRLNRANRRNAIDAELAHLLMSAIRMLEADDSLRVGVISGAGAGFCSGMDLAAFAREGVPPELNELLSSRCTKPLIAAVEGFAIAGGLELALRCDLIVAARDARFALPEAKVGLVAPYGIGFLQRSLSRQAVAEFVLVGSPISADRAYSLGLVNRLCDPGLALAAAGDLARRIVANAPLAISTSLALIQAAEAVPEDDYLRSMGAIAERVYSSADSVEGASAFLERRAPVWSGG